MLLWMQLVVLVGAALMGPVRGMAAASESSSPLASSDTVYQTWREEFPNGAADDSSASLHLMEDEKDPTHTLPRRKILSTSQEQTNLLYNPFDLSSATRRDDDEGKEPHKLRTDRWELMVHWRRRAYRPQRERLELEFSDNGYVRLVSSSSSASNAKATTAIGRWELASHGLTWSLTLPQQYQQQQEHVPSTVTFHGDLLLNPFGPQPRIIRGVVLRETTHRWFRPVVATFTGDGIGQDTADLSYRNRKSSL